MVAVQQSPQFAELPQFACHKVVRAGKIRTINAGDGAQVILELDTGKDTLVQTVTQDWYAKHQPQPGGYFVVYADAYQSFSPAKAFEEGYTPIVEEPPGRVSTEDMRDAERGLSRQGRA